LKPSLCAARHGHGRRDEATKYLRAVLSLALIASAAIGPNAATANGGGSGTVVTPSPVVTDVRCVPTPPSGCVDRLWAEPGSSIELRGRNLQSSARVLFYGRKGKADDVYSPSLPGLRGRVTAAVPRGAVSGPVAVEAADGKRSRRWSGLVIDDPTVTPPLPPQSGAAPAIGARIAERKVFYGGVHKAVFSYRVSASRPVDVGIKLVRVADGTVVQAWQDPQVPPGAVQRVAWNGRSGGKAQPDGLYAFQAAVGAAAASESGAGAAPSADAFNLLGHMFPVRGRHDFGGSSGRFGAGRTGHSHQGQDMFARCGTPLVAARAGKVIFKGYHRLAGYYLVISGSATDQDYVYAHLRAPSFVNEGDRVLTGQPIGEVGDSGNAQGCHLHFELWSAPGWYRGGQPFDPLPQLRQWDSSS
jgi:murein DD-endopeptidase MepM/ murein hydrolase activator NlpD